MIAPRAPDALGQPGKAQFAMMALPRRVILGESKGLYLALSAWSRCSVVNPRPVICLGPRPAFRKTAFDSTHLFASEWMFYVQDDSPIELSYLGRGQFGNNASVAPWSLTYGKTLPSKGRKMKYAR